MLRIFKFALVLVVALAGAAWYLHWSRIRSLDSGEVYVREQPDGSLKPLRSETASANEPARPQEQAANPAEARNDQNRAKAQSGVYTLPTSDTISRTPPNQAIIAGSGRFQLYRQGDITWRMDTATGHACVLFATEAMWRKALVYEHGCGAS